MAFRIQTTLTSKLLKWYANLYMLPYPIPPYRHICEIGDPVLRLKARSVDIDQITSDEVQIIIRNLTHVMRKNGLIGLSAPQIGSSNRIFIAEFTSSQMKKFDYDEIISKEIEVFPLQVFINPTVTVVDNRKVRFHEECGCIKGYSAIVPRNYEIKVKAFDETGKEFEWQRKGWTARILQHEIDHLDGQLYIDKMDVQTFQYNLWHIVNRKRGKRPWKIN